MTPIIEFDVRGVPAPTPELRARDEADAPAPPPKPGSFEDRYAEVDLVDIVRNGVPEVDYLPGSSGMLVRGKRHLVSAGAKSLKSLGLGTVLLSDMALAGAKVALLDVENGPEENARRLAALIQARELTDDEQRRIQDNLLYVPSPRMRKDDGPVLAQAFAGYDLVVFDSQRMLLSQWGLKEDAADDYAQWMHFGIEPFFRAGIATLILDNTGHSEAKRSRGTSAKADLNEVMFSMAVVSPVSLSRRGRVRLAVERSRFGTEGTWYLEMGAGHFGSWQEPGSSPAMPDAFLTEVLAVLTEDFEVLGKDAIRKRVKERKPDLPIGTEKARRAFEAYIADPTIPIERDGRHGLRYSGKPPETAPPSS